MPFLQLSFECESFDPEELESACFEAGALAVTLSDAADSPILEPYPGETPLWPAVHATLLFDAEASREQILISLEAALGRSLPHASFSELADRVWEREWLTDFRPMSFGTRLWICPHEQEVTQNGAIVVRLDPGLAFGTGTHPTTAMCLRWLDGARLAGKEVLDYGCGSGILAIAALKLGARHALAIDHDPQALLAALDNAARNGVERQMTVAAPDTAAPRADVLLANILAQPLIELAPRFQTMIRAGGSVVLSGILREQAEAVAEAYRPWFELEPPALQDVWVCLHGIRR